MGSEGKQDGTVTIVVDAKIKEDSYFDRTFITKLDFDLGSFDHEFLGNIRACSIVKKLLEVGTEMEFRIVKDSAISA